MTQRVKVADLKVGDVMRATKIARVFSVSRGFVGLYDDITGVKSYLAEQLGVDIELLSRPARKVKVGDVLTGEEVQAHQWKRGTIIGLWQHCRVLAADGRWTSLPDGARWNFSDLDANDYHVLYLPE